MTNVKCSINKSGTYVATAFFVAMVGASASLWNYTNKKSDSTEQNYKFADSKFGNYLAAQHAIYVNNFDTASKLLAGTSMKNDKILADFLAGNPISESDAASFKTSTDFSGRMIYVAHLAQSGNWEKIYSMSKMDNSAFFAPIRIWSGIACNKTKEVLKFVEKSPVNESWKSFVIGQIHAENKKIDTAAKYFEKVSIDFINLNDYLYLLAFYKNANLNERANKLQQEFTARAGGIFTLQYDLSPDFANYSGIGSNMAFGLIQSVSHSGQLNETDVAIVLLRIAGFALNGKTAGDLDIALNYYIGNYFWATGGDYWNKYFSTIPKSSPYRPFVLMKFAESAGNDNEISKKLNDVISDNSLFIPAINKLVSKNMQAGRGKDAIKIINRALNNDKLTDQGRAFMLKNRSRIYLSMNKLQSAQQDIVDALDIMPNDAEIMNTQARIWIANKSNLNNAYAYALALVKKFPSELEYWDTLGLSVRSNEGAKEALEIYERISKVAMSCSSLFEHLGDIYVDLGDHNKAADSYNRAIALSHDGLVSIPALNKKLRNIR